MIRSDQLDNNDWKNSVHVPSNNSEYTLYIVWNQSDVIMSLAIFFGAETYSISTLFNSAQVFGEDTY